MSEPDDARIHPVWFYRKDQARSMAFERARDQPLMNAILGQLKERDRIVGT
jgi:hypothetical protein